MDIKEIANFAYSDSPLDANIFDTPRYRDMLKAIRDHLSDLNRAEAVFAVEKDIPANGDLDLYELINSSMDQNHLVDLDEGYQAIQERIHAQQATPREQSTYQLMHRSGHRETGYFYDLPNSGRYGSNCYFMKFNRQGEYRLLDDKDIIRFINNLLKKVNSYVQSM